MRGILLAAAGIAGVAYYLKSHPGKLDQVKGQALKAYDQVKGKVTEMYENKI